jgi:hypothetical protein
VKVALINGYALVSNFLTVMLPGFCPAAEENTTASSIMTRVKVMNLLGKRMLRMFLINYCKRKPRC